MFTGIIEEIGSVARLEKSEKGAVLTIQAKKVLDDTQLGDSIAVNGVCLTVTSISGNQFTADVMAETMRRTGLGGLSIGSDVNLERALLPTTRIGGHIVSGHIDDTGTIAAYKKEDNATWVTINTGSNILRYVVEKGSVAIDGISLTVAYVDKNCFKVSLIPHTSQQTTLLNKGIGSTVNLECDIIAKYVEKLMGCKSPNEPEANGEIDRETLVKYGFI